MYPTEFGDYTPQKRFVVESINDQLLHVGERFKRPESLCQAHRFKKDQVIEALNDAGVKKDDKSISYLGFVFFLQQLSQYTELKHRLPVTDEYDRILAAAAQYDSDHSPRNGHKEEIYYLEAPFPTGTIIAFRGADGYDQEVADIACTNHADSHVIRIEMFRILKEGTRYMIDPDHEQTRVTDASTITTESNEPVRFPEKSGYVSALSTIPGIPSAVADGGNKDFYEAFYIVKPSGCRVLQRGDLSHKGKDAGKYSSLVIEPVTNMFGFGEFIPCIERAHGIQKNQHLR